MTSFVQKEFLRATEFAEAIATPRQVALERCEDRSGEFVSPHWALESVGVHTFNAHWAVRAKSHEAKRLVAAQSMGFQSWDETPAEYQDAALKLRLYVPALAYVPDALACARVGLRGASRRTIDDVVGHHVRLNHPHEGAAFKALGVWAGA